ncbi:MAG: ABC transporter ATP-binding protein [Anaerolineae bacterium]|nr:ABC transporter ATP-binding protein [Anaerolineae bacterium]
MIKLTDISRHFAPSRAGRAAPDDPAVRAVDGVSLELPAGSTTVIYGPSGSGKTTLLRLIAGLERPDAGEILIAGALASTPGWVLPPHQRGVGFVFQDPALWPHLTVAQNVAFGLRSRPRREIAALVDEVLASMELEGLQRRYPNQLSGGQARRVAIARTLVVNPRCLLLDEPLTHLQPDLALQVLEEIRAQVTARSMTLLYVTHSVGEAARLGGRHLRMVNGQIEAADG